MSVEVINIQTASYRLTHINCFNRELIKYHPAAKMTILVIMLLLGFVAFCEVTIANFNCRAIVIQDLL